MPIVTEDKQLAQRTPTTTSDAVLYSKPTSVTTTYVKSIVVCNTTAASKTYSLWINQNGTQTGDQFALIKNMTIAANASDQRIYPGDAAIILKGDAPNLMVNTSVGSALTFTIYGTEVSET